MKNFYIYTGYLTNNDQYVHTFNYMENKSYLFLSVMLVHASLLLTSGCTSTKPGGVVGEERVGREESIHPPKIQVERVTQKKAS